MAEPASDNQMAAEALSPVVSRDPARRQQRLEDYRDRLYRLVQDSPDSIRPATVFFNSGLTTERLQLLMEEHRLEVIDAHVKAPQGNNGVVMSIMFGSSDLLASDGDLSSRLSFVIDAHQKCFAKSAKFRPADDALEWMDLSTVPFLVYSARIFGSARALQQLQNNSGVTSVMLNLREQLIDDFQNQKKTKGPNIYNMPGFLC
jgi:hypothetical protein